MHLIHFCFVKKIYTIFACKMVALCTHRPLRKKEYELPSCKVGILDSSSPLGDTKGACEEPALQPVCLVLISPRSLGGRGKRLFIKTSSFTSFRTPTRNRSSVTDEGNTIPYRPLSLPLSRRERGKSLPLL